MPNFSLGDGINSITGEKIISGSDIFITPYSSIFESYNYIDYDLEIIRNYKELRKFLNIQHPLLASISHISESTNLEIANSINLNNVDTTFIFKFRKIYQIKKLKNVALKNNITTSFEKFYKDYGDEYITQIKYGREIYAIITYNELEKDRALDIKQHLNIIFKQIQGLKLTAAEKINYKKDFLNKYKNCTINIKCSGSDLYIPSFVTSLNSLFTILKTFNNDKNEKYAPIDYKSEPYARGMHTNQGLEFLEEKSILAKNYLYKYDNKVSHLNLLINTLERISKIHNTCITDEKIINLRERIENAKNDIIKQICTIKKAIIKNINFSSFDRYIAEIKIPSLEIEVLEMLNSIKDTNYSVYITSGRVKLKNIIKQKSSSGSHLNLGLSGNVKLFWSIEPDNTLTVTRRNNIQYKVLRKRKDDFFYHDLGLKFKGSGTTIAVNNFSENDKYCIAKPKNNKGENFTVVVRKA